MKLVLNDVCIHAYRKKNSSQIPTLQPSTWIKSQVLTPYTNYVNIALSTAETRKMCLVWYCTLNYISKNPSFILEMVGGKSASL